MEPRLTNDEQKMRDAMLRHEFPFEEQAWKAMQALLQPHEPPPAPGPASPKAGHRLKKGTWPFLTLLLFSGIGAVAWWAWPLPQTPDPWASEMDHAAMELDSDTLGHFWGNAQSSRPNDQSSSSSPKADRSLPSEAASARYVGQGAALAGTTSSNSFSNKSANRKQAPRSAGGAPVPYVSRETGAAAGTTSNPSPNETSTRDQAPRPAEEALASQVSRETEAATAGVASNPSSGETSGQDQAPHSAEEAPASHISREVGGEAALLDPLPLQPLALPGPADSLVRPVEDQRRQPSRWQRGWLFGLGIHTVAYDPLYLRGLPHVGHLFRYRFDPRTSVQAEVSAKLVSGYGLRAEFVDILPGNTSSIVLETDRFLFLEVPLLVHRQYAPDKAWLLGVKTAFVHPIQTSGSNSGFFSGGNFIKTPRRWYTVRDGVRVLDLGLVLGWEWRYHPRWSFDVRYNQGLFDLTVDGFYRSRAYHLNSDLQVSLRRFIVRNKKTRSHEPKPLFPTPAGR